LGSSKLKDTSDEKSRGTWTLAGRIEAVVFKKRQRWKKEIKSRINVVPRRTAKIPDTKGRKSCIGPSAAIRIQSRSAKRAKRHLQSRLKKIRRKRRGIKDRRSAT